MRFFIERPGIIEDQPDIFTELEGCAVLIFLHFLEHGGEVHRMFDDVEIPGRDRFSDGLTKPGAFFVIVQTLENRRHLLSNVFGREVSGTFHQRFAARIDRGWTIARCWIAIDFLRFHRFKIQGRRSGFTVWSGGRIRPVLLFGECRCLKKNERVNRRNGERLDLT